MVERLGDWLSSLSARWGMIAAALVAIVATLLLSDYRSTDQQLRVARELVIPQAATGSIHIVEIDSRSVREMESWPWKRRLHGKLVDQLHRAGAKVVAFDVDFSSPSNPEDDQIFADALGRFGGGAILPTFRQLVSDTGNIFAENIPIEPLRNNAFLGSVNVHPDPDGAMRTFPFGTVTDGTARPSLAALIADHSGMVDDNFRLSSAILPDSIPRHSATDIINGRFNPKDVEGKTMLVGATAIEMGDRYAVDGHGVIPGVVVQAMAAESLLQNLDYPNYGPVPAIIAALLGAGYASNIWRLQRRLTRLGLVGVLIILTPFAMEGAHLGTIEILPGLVGIAGTFTAAGFIDYVRRLSLARLNDSETGLPNGKALAQQLSKSRDGTLIVMSVKSFRSITVQLNSAETVALYEQMVSRIHAIFGTVKVFQLGDGRLSWVDMSPEKGPVTDAIDSLAAMFLSKFQLTAHQIVATPAFGIADMISDKAALCIQHAALAASRAAEQGHRWVRYGDEMGDSAIYAQKLLAEVDDALTQRELYPVFQPKWSIAEGRINGVEALLRWNHPERGHIRPDHFIPILEDNSRMQDVTLYVFDCCAEQAVHWLEKGLDIKIALNVSAPLFADPGFTKTLINRVKALGAKSKRLVIEITESAVVTNTESTIHTLNVLRALGVGVSIDDYGTGQSTLSYLKRFPADEIKIDQSFVSRMLDSPSDQILVRSTIEMAHELGFAVVAEGVEDAECLARLKEFGCDTVQGWHISKPKTAPEIEAMMDAEERSVAA
jgi:diguanylate cyclase